MLGLVGDEGGDPGTKVAAVAPMVGQVVGRGLDGEDAAGQGAQAGGSRSPGRIGVVHGQDDPGAGEKGGVVGVEAATGAAEAGHVAQIAGGLPGQQGVELAFSQQ
jgi:hypothetical protein